MSKWLNQHLQALGLVLNRLAKHWFNTFMICAVIGVTVAIPSLVYVIINNASHLVTNIKQGAQMSLFLKQDVNQDTITSITKELESNDKIKQFNFVSKEQALQRLTEESHNKDIIATLETNPLPHAFYIEPKDVTQASTDQLINTLNGLDGVEEVIIDSSWMSRLNSLLNIGTQAVWILAGLLGFALLAVISNTVRMQILTHKEEIEVSQLFGATQSFIRRPFLYLGAIYGLLGGLFASATLWFVVHLFNQNVTQIASQYQSEFSLALQPQAFTAIVILSICIGWLAAFLGVYKN